MDIYLACPHCDLLIDIPTNDINCAIYRHGVYKKSGLQMGPHLCKEDCESLAKHGLIWGCGKPFKLIYTPEPRIVKCEYI